MEGPDRKYRKAPRRENIPESENLDAMIVIPAMNEGEHIIDSIYTAVHQRAHEKKGIRHGVVVVVNNRPSAGKDVKFSNLRTYLLLQALEHKFPISMSGDKDFNEKVKFIQEQNVPIHIIDSFSEGYAHPNSNVGRARRIGTEHALAHVKPEGFIVSTDADTQLGEWVIASAERMFELNENVVGTRINMTRHLDGTNVAEKRASAAQELCWGVSQFVDSSEAYIEEEFVWMAGAGSIFRAENYRQLAAKGSGYTDIPGHEDTMLGSSIADEGWVIRDMSRDFRSLHASTRQRFSERASVGYGQGMLKFDLEKTPFKDLLVDSPEYKIKKDAFFKDVEDIYYKDLCEKYDKYPDRPIDDLFDVFSNRSLGKPFVEDFIADTKDQATERFIGLCKKYGFTQADADTLTAIYRRWKPNQEMGRGHHDFIETGKEIFEKMYPKVHMEDLYLRMREQCVTDNEAQKDKPIIKQLEERFSEIPWTLEAFERSVLAHAEASGAMVENPDHRLRMQCAILSSYKKVFDRVHDLLTKASVEEEQRTLERSNEPKDVSILNILRAMEVPSDLLMRRFAYDTWWKEAAAIAEIRNTLLYENTDAVSEALMQRSIGVSEHASDFYEKHVREESEAFRAASADIIARTEKALAELDAKNKAARLHKEE